VSGRTLQDGIVSRPWIDVHHFFTFRDDKIACYRSAEDTAQTEAALQS
jgi:hypothetical protein